MTNGDDALVERVAADIESFMLGRVGREVCRNAAKSVLALTAASTADTAEPGSYFKAMQEAVAQHEADTATIATLREALEEARKRIALNIGDYDGILGRIEAALANTGISNG